MKTIFGILVSTFFCFQANALHVYANYVCQSKNGITLKYDGPGSNYSVGGFSNFYNKNRADKFLSFENFEGIENSIGDAIGDSGPLHVTFDFVDYRIQGEVKVTPVDPTSCEGYEYEHSEWNSVRTVKITDISNAASTGLGLKKDSVLIMTCEETMDVPIRCDQTKRYTGTFCDESLQYSPRDCGTHETCNENCHDISAINEVFRRSDAAIPKNFDFNREKLGKAFRYAKVNETVEFAVEEGDLKKNYKVQL